jgi:PIN domain nuclease of toxin-antitoxin system
MDDNLDRKVLELLLDPVNFFHASYVVVKELIHLLKQERIRLSKQQKDQTVLQLLNEAGIKITPVTHIHLTMYERLEYIQDHKDPNDMLIIAQSISDQIPLISSDHKFKHYIPQGLELIFNKR